MAQKKVLFGKTQITSFDGLPPDLGKEVLGREIPSDEALVTPLVFRVTLFLQNEGIIEEQDRNRIGLCIQEALRNAVIHGNGGDFRKLVRLKVFVDENRLWVRVDDEGGGFDLNKIPDLHTEEAVWGEKGRGLGLLCQYMDRVSFYRNGSTLVMTRFL